MTECRLSGSTDIPAIAQQLPPELQRAVQALCDTYESIDLRIETTLGMAEADFIASMPEVQNHKSELRQLAKYLIADVRANAGADAEHSSNRPVLLRLAYQDQQDLVEQLLPNTRASVVVMPVEGDVSLHANINGALT